MGSPRVLDAVALGSNVLLGNSNIVLFVIALDSTQSSLRSCLGLNTRAVYALAR